MDSRERGYDFCNEHGGAEHSEICGAGVTETLARAVGKLLIEVDALRHFAEGIGAMTQCAEVNLTEKADVTTPVRKYLVVFHDRVIEQARKALAGNKGES